MPVYNSRVPGAVNWLPRAEPAVSGPVAYPAEGSPGPPQGAPGTVSTLPQAGSPLMAALVKYVQSRNPAVAVNEGNVGGFTQGLFTGGGPGRHGRGWSIPGPGRNLLQQLVQAGLARSPFPRTWGNNLPYGHFYEMFNDGGKRAVAGRGVGTSIVSASPSGGGVSAPMVPVATLPEPQVPLTSGGVGVQAAPFAANTPVGPMLYPPLPTYPLFGSQDPRRR